MNRWRPVIVLFFLLVTSLSATALIMNEVIPAAKLREEVRGRDEPLRNVVYRPGNRSSNLRDMGFSDDMIDLTVAEARKLDPVKKRLRKVLSDQALDVAPTFCPNNSALPQPYAALEFLVVQEGGERDVVQARNALFAFERQRWYSVESSPAGVYERLERAETRRPDATLMGVAALLAMKERDAIDGIGAFSTGFFSGGFSSLVSDQPSIRPKTAQYFALMHVLTELANEPDGICLQ